MRAVIWMCLAAFCSGCAFTHAVTQIGERHEVFQVHQVLVATNGVVAIDCTASYYSLKSIGEDSGWASRIKFRTKKYLVATPQVVDWTITNAIPAPKNYRRHARSQPVLASIETNAGKTNQVLISQLICGTTNSMSWMIIPHRYGGRDATLQDLPQEFDEVATSYNGKIFPYAINGQDFQVHLPADNAGRTYRKWWGYPAQILIFPAIAVDVVTWPYQFYIVCKSLSEIQ